MKKLAILMAATGIFASATIPAWADSQPPNIELIREQARGMLKEPGSCKVVCEEMMKNKNAKKMMCEMMAKDPEAMKMMMAK
jgi:hypothetical protein